MATQATHPATPGHFINHQSRGHRGIEARCGAPQGDAYHLVAGAAREHRQPFGFRAGDDHKGAGEIGFLERHRAFGG